MNQSNQNPAKPDPGIATVLSFYSIGLGHVYAGRWLRGFCIFFGYPIVLVAYVIGSLRWINLGAPEDARGYWALGLIAFGWAASWIFVAWVAWDAQKCAEKKNDALKSH